MKINPIKAVSAVMACSLVIPVAACNKGGHGGNKSSGSGECRSGRKIEEDTPWFDVNEKVVENNVDPNKKVDSLSHEIAGVDENNIVVLTAGIYEMPGEEIPEDISDYVISQIEVLDKHTLQTVNSFDMKTKLEKNSFLESASYVDGVITATGGTYDASSESVKKFEKQFDPKTGDEISSHEIEEEPNGIYYDSTRRFGDYTVKTATDWSGEKSKIEFFVYDQNGGSKTFELSDATLDFYYVAAMVQLEGTNAVVIVETDKDRMYYNVDWSNASATPSDAAEYEWLGDIGVAETFVGDDGCTYFTTEEGVKKVDVKNKTVDLVFEYSSCGVSRSTLNNATLVYCEEDSYIFAGNQALSSWYEREETRPYEIYAFTKAEKNPHAGKSVLELLVGDRSVSAEISNCIIKFNDSNSDYYIEVTDRYSAVLDFSDMNSDDDLEAYELQRNAQMSNQLAMDIMNGEGPDILMNTCEMGQLNNSNYLVDLSTCLGDFDSNKYFTNIVDAAKVDNKLYQLPLTYTVDGIQTNAKYAGKSGVGFTTEEYEKFIADTLNGSDVITLGQSMYFTKLFSGMSDKFVADGKVDFSSEDFQKIAEFVKDYAPESSISWDEKYNDIGAVGATFFKGASEKVAMYYRCYGISSYLINIKDLGDANSILGVPSTDGRGPSIGALNSVAISAQAVDTDACVEFVKLLTSDEIQLNLALCDNFVISRDAFRAAGKKAVEYLNKDNIQEMYGFDPASGKTSFNEQNISDMENIIQSCSSLNNEDAGIATILIEEMPAYFAGQKDLSEVASIAQDRAQKVMDERG